MIYYVYYDSYGNPREAISADELRDRFAGDPEIFRASIRGESPSTEHMNGQVGTVNFSGERELEEFLEAMEEVNRGFFEGEGDSRPYNF